MTLSPLGTWTTTPTGSPSPSGSASLGSSATGSPSTLVTGTPSQTLPPPTGSPSRTPPPAGAPSASTSTVPSTTPDPTHEVLCPPEDPNCRRRRRVAAAVEGGMAGRVLTTLTTLEPAATERGSNGAVPDVAVTATLVGDDRGADIGSDPARHSHSRRRHRPLSAAVANGLLLVPGGRHSLHSMVGSAALASSSPAAPYARHSHHHHHRWGVFGRGGKAPEANADVASSSSDADDAVAADTAHHHHHLGAANGVGVRGWLRGRWWHRRHGGAGGGDSGGGSGSVKSEAASGYAVAAEEEEGSHPHPRRRLQSSPVPSNATTNVTLPSSSNVVLENVVVVRDGALERMWLVVYWSTFLLTYIINPLVQEYVAAGEWGGSEQGWGCQCCV